MAYAPGGEYTMGSTEEDVDSLMRMCRGWGWRCNRTSFEMEQPAHMVALNGFWIDRTEVTNRQYGKCVEAGACRAPATKCDWGEPTYGDASKRDHPVVCVSWYQAQDYCAWAEARLPTDSEWEYAARGEKRSVYPWGNEFDCARVNSDEEPPEDKFSPGGRGCDGYKQTSPAGAFPAGASWCGALDMAGNVWEWVADWYETYPSERQLNPTGPSSGWAKVLRSGTWFHNPFGVRSADRDYSRPKLAWGVIGFRCAKSSP
jgi:eukaryotic-like serine/threonine-protein kinase